MVPPTDTEPWSAVLVTTTSADVWTAVDWMTVLLAVLGSGLAEASKAVLLIVVPAGTFALTWTTSVNTCGPELAARVVREAVTTPKLPTGGVATVQPAGAVSDTNVVFVGSESFNCTVSASLGPAFATVTV